MNERPNLDARLDGKTFRSYYYLKEELIDFCRNHGLPVTGGKIELTDRIAHFLDTGELLPPSKKESRGNAAGEIDENTIIEQNVVYSEKLRAFFVAKIGKGFTFNVPFQRWLKSNVGKTYADAIEAYPRLLKEKKENKTAIDRQFEYNTYVRDFFADNSCKSLNDAIACWKYKKSLQGHNRYERADLVAIERKND